MDRPSSSPGRRLVDALARRDREALAAVLDDQVDFRGLTPGRAWEAGTAAEVVEVLLGSWFEEQDRVVDVVSVEEDAVADTRRVGYRLDLELPDGPYVVEQQAYYRAEGDRISHLRVLCSGFRRR